MTIQRAIITQDTSGGQVESWQNVYTSLPVNLQTISNSWQLRYSQKSIDASHTAYFNSNPTIKPGDRMLYNNRIFYVVGQRDQINLGEILAVDMQELTK